MSRESPLEFRLAAEPWEFEAIHRLNYRTFVEEIPQHPPNPEQRLVDKFHAENVYAICLSGTDLVGMVAGRAQRPFSLDQKLPDLDAHLPPGRRAMEVRLLSVAASHRKGTVFARLVGLLARHYRALGYDLALISGTLRQQRLYRHLGFTPFGPVVGSGDAQFQPMYLTLESFLEIEQTLSRPSPAASRGPASFLPGPVGIHSDVRDALGREPVSHRSSSFAADFRATRRLLCQLTGARHVEILLGSGTLANDAVGGQLSLLGEPGLVLSNGEFGDRLVDHATRWGLEFETIRCGWGEPFDGEELRRRIAERPGAGWLWAVHGETSTGMMNDLSSLKAVCADAGVRLCIDGISSIGTTPVDLRGVFLASCVSGKALASFPGLSLVFHDHDIAPAPRALPRYVDLGLYAAEGGVPFTTSSNLVHALETALLRADWPGRFARVAEASRRLRARLREAGFRVVAPEAHAAPAVVTIALPDGATSAGVGREMESRGFLLSCRSGYLERRRWVQVCLMGEWESESLDRLPDALVEVCSPTSART